MLAKQNTIERRRLSILSALLIGVAQNIRVPRATAAFLQNQHERILRSAKTERTFVLALMLLQWRKTKATQKSSHCCSRKWCHQETFSFPNTFVLIQNNYLRLGYRIVENYCCSLIGSWLCSIILLFFCVFLFFVCIYQSKIYLSPFSHEVTTVWL